MSNPMAAYYPGGSNPAAPVTITGTDPNQTVLTVRAAPGQIQSLQSWLDASGATAWQIFNNGDMVSGSHLLAAKFLRAGTTSFTDQRALWAIGQATNVPTSVVQGIASQSANLQEWQNSGGTPLASVSSAGAMGVLGGVSVGDFTAQRVALYGFTGVPSNGIGANGDIGFRNDGGAGTTIYQKRAGAWVATAA